MKQTDLVVIGAGPAGMAAAVTAAENGLGVTLLDEQLRPGGQIYRDVDRAAEKRGNILGPDFKHGKVLTKALRDSTVDHVSGAVVWAIEDGFRISYTNEGRASQVAADRILLATGALERPMPVPGWTLPGVMTAGAAQILLKQSGVIARRAVLIGSGPLLYLIAAQMLRADTPPLALIETQTRADLLRATRHLGGALQGWSYLAKGLKLMAEIARARVPRYTGATQIAIEGDGRAEAVSFQSKGRNQRLECDTVLLHHGVVPNTQAARSIGVPHSWSTAQTAFVPATDQWGATEVPGVSIAGDGAGIGGAEVAEIAGRLAALQILTEAKRLTETERDRLSAPLFKRKARDLAIRPFLETAYPPVAEALLPEDATIICRCEEVTAGDVRRYAQMGCLGPNQTKAFGRPGMGPCQGRYCGLSVTSILSKSHGQTPDETGYYRIRPPLKPVTLGELAAMETPGQSAAE